MRPLELNRIFVLTGAALTFLLFLSAAPPASAGTVWNGPTIQFTDSQTGNPSLDQDMITPNVHITRLETVDQSGGGLYNAVLETGATAGTSPAGTQWAVGTLANTNLSYGPCPLEKFNNPPSKVNTTYVVHLLQDDIYLQLTLNAWAGAGGFGTKTFTYTRTTAPAATPPSVSITNPVTGAVFSAPVNLKLGASASVSGGTVTNVQFFANSTNSLGSVTAAPFDIVSSPLNAGSYSLTAVATAAGLSTTSSSVNISVVNPVTVTLSGLHLAAGQFSFSYSATPGLSYVILSSPTAVGGWTPVQTNVAASNPATYSGPFNPAGATFFRVSQLPNP